MTNHYNAAESHSYWMNHQGDIVGQEDGEVSSPGDGYSAATGDRKHSDGSGREWDRNREYDRDRDRRRRSRSRSRSGDRRRRRERSKRRDWSSESGSDTNSPRRNQRRRSRSRSWDRNKRDRDRPYEHEQPREREHDRNETWRSAPPNNTIMVSNLPLHFTENEIRSNIMLHGLVPKEIRLIRRKDTGTSRGFAFVEFVSVPEAERWMTVTQGYLMLDQFQATLQYSNSRDSFNDKIAKGAQDWFCIHCGEHNFKRREICFKCQSPRAESELVSDVQREISLYPTNTVLLRNMDALTTEDSVLGVLQNIPGVCSLPIKSVRIGRDPLNNISRGICYLDMNNTTDSMRLFAGLSDIGSLVIDGREVMVSYCKPQNAMTPAAMATTAAKSSTSGSGMAAVAAAQWSVSNAANNGSQAPVDVNFTKEEIPRMAEYSASMYAKTPEEHASYLQYYTQYYMNQLQASSVKTETAPDLSKYVFDEKSGYYYDSSTNLYYDAKTQYFYNPLTQQFNYWDNALNKFIPAPSSDQDSATSAAAVEKEDKKEKPEKQDKVNVAKKIAKDMEKWAKTLNQRKESTKVAAPAPEYEPERRREREPEIQVEKTSNQKDSLDEVLQMQQILQRKAATVSSSKKPLGASALVGYGSDSDGDVPDEKKLAEMLENLVDWSKLACLLCKRQFNNKETLVKHQQMSDLHKQNLEAWKKQHTPAVYRDRAKERRQKFGDSEPQKKKDSYSRSRRDRPEPVAASSSYDRPQQSDLTSNNVGNKLLQKMGWQEGQGLGKGNQGRTTIIEAERRSAQAGLGMKTYAVAGDDYRASVKKLAMMRFKELNDES